ncbi:MAG: SDR family oxidoreductase [Xanthomonadales bacterium]|jgi:NAD(P)-dependent dehydrogenase (short-subunit alcohol dehydrogenase family)|nr:SDR family oxidoreductase [Xanthomonadales bacterium]
MSVKAVLTGHRRGLGRGIAIALLARGIHVLGISRSVDPDLGAEHPRLLTRLELDLADTPALLAWLATGALSDFLADASQALLINNAGVVTPMGTLAQQDAHAVAAAVAINVSAPLVLSAAFVQATAHSADRRVLHLSSGAGRKAYPGWSVYGATKAALDHHARAAPLDAVPGLRVVSLAPGVIATDMQAEIRSTDPERFPLRERFVELEREGGLVEPAEAGARVVEYLLAADFGRMPVSDLRDPA